MASRELRARRWRRAPSRGVSEIVGTILLVVIGVVLAAVVYVLVAGLVRGPSTDPIGPAFVAGNPHASNGIGAAGSSTCGATTTTLASAVKTGDWTYTLDIETSSAGLGDLLLQVRTATGALDPTHVAFYMTNTNGIVIACAGSSAMPASGSMSAGLPFSYPAAGGASGATLAGPGDQVVLEMGPSNPAGQGYTFDAVGQGRFSGVTSAVPLH